MSVKRHFALTEQHEVTRCLEEHTHPSMKRLRISDTSQDLKGGDEPQPDHDSGTLPPTVAASPSGSNMLQHEQYGAMNALLKQLHMERMHRLQSLEQHLLNGPPH